MLLVYLALAVVVMIVAACVVYNYAAIRRALPRTDFEGALHGAKPARPLVGKPAGGENRPRVVFSITSTPDRLGHLHETVQSLIDSDVKPDAVYVNLPKVSRRTGKAYPVVLSEELERMKITHSSVLRVLRPDRDVGPLTKLHPVLKAEHDPMTVIITADDDEIYPPAYHTDLLAAALRNPTAAFGYRGLMVRQRGGGEGGEKPSLEYEFVHGVDKVREVDVIEGYTGGVYRRGFFSTDWEPPSDDSACITCDDIYISSYLRGRGVPRVVIGGGLPMGDERGVGNARAPARPRNEVAAISPLYAANHSDGNRNERCLSEVWDVFMATTGAT